MHLLTSASDNAFVLISTIFETLLLFYQGISCVGEIARGTISTGKLYTDVDSKVYINPYTLL